MDIDHTLPMPKCPYCKSKNLMVMEPKGLLSDTQIIVVFGCRDCKQLSKIGIEFIRED